jgi:hypothetical protein
MKITVVTSLFAKGNMDVDTSHFEILNDNGKFTVYVS